MIWGRGNCRIFVGTNFDHDECTAVFSLIFSDDSVGVGLQCRTLLQREHVSKIHSRTYKTLKTNFAFVLFKSLP